MATGLNEACFIEWAASPSDEPGDPATWRRCVPGLGALIDEATIRADMAAMPPALFKRSYLNLQPHEAAEDWAVIPEEDWSAVEDPS